MLRGILLLLTIQCAACQQVLKGKAPENGTINSLGFPDGYNMDGDTSTFNIQNTDRSGGVQLKFIDLDLNSKSSIAIYSASSTSVSLSQRKLLVRIDNSDLDRERVYHIDEPVVFVVFSKGCCGSSNAAGFKALYSFVSYTLESWTSKPFTRCGVLSGYGGNVSLATAFQRNSDSVSPPRYVDCIWLLKAPAETPTKGRSPMRMLFQLITYQLTLHEGGTGEVTIRDGVTSSSAVLHQHQLNSREYFPPVLSWANNSAGLYIRLTARSLPRFDFGYAVLHEPLVRKNASADVQCPGDFDFPCRSWRTPLCLDRRLLCDLVPHCPASKDKVPDDEDLTFCRTYVRPSSWPSRQLTLAHTPPVTTQVLLSSEDDRGAAAVGLFDSKPIIIASCVTLMLIVCCVSLIGIVIALKRGHLKWLRAHATRMFDQNDLDHSLFNTPNRTSDNSQHQHKRSFVERMLYLLHIGRNETPQSGAMRLRDVSNPADSSTTITLLTNNQQSSAPSDSSCSRTDTSRLPVQGRLPPIGATRESTYAKQAAQGRLPQNRPRGSAAAAATAAAAASPSHENDDATVNDDASSVCSNFTRLTPPTYSAAVRL